jgi:phosphoribosylformylglycinamidine synthase
MRALYRAIERELVRSCHDCSEGGLAVAVAEMAFAGDTGVTVRLADVPRSAQVNDDVSALFSESCGRFLVEVAAADAAAFESEMGDTPWACIGATGGDTLHITGLQGQTIVEAGLSSLKAAWQGGDIAYR